MSWLQILGLVLKLALAIANLIRDRKLMSAGEAAANVKALGEINARIEKARAARSAAASGGVPDDDPFRRD